MYPCIEMLIEMALESIFSDFTFDFFNYENKTFEDLWKRLPWIIQEIKRLIKKRDCLFITQKTIGKTKDRHHFRQVKHLIQTKVRIAYDHYLQDLLGLADQSADENPSGFIPKSFTP